jgi:hypothetical protein
MEKMNPEKISRDNQADKIVRFLDRIDAYEYFQNILKGEEQKPSFEDFENFLVRLNGIARNIPVKERSADGDGVRLSGIFDTVLMPGHKDKIEILKYAYDNLEKVDKDDLKYLVPAIINAVHLFSDGNGRTSRIIYQLLKRYSSKTNFEHNMKIGLGNYGRYNLPDINPGPIFSEVQEIVLKKKGWQFNEDKRPIGPGSLSTGKGISGPDIAKLDKNHESYNIAKKCLDIYSIDGLYVLSAIHSVLGDEKIESFFTDKYTVCKISPLQMIDQLKKDEWQKIIDSYFQLKKEHIETIVDLFIAPDNFETREGTNLKDLFIERIHKNYERNKE